MRHVANILRRGPGPSRRAALACLLGAALPLACFNPPAEPVQFACEPDDAAECPDGYECRLDGCCHREDTPDNDAFGACKLGLGGGGGGGGSSPPTSPPTTGDETSASATDATSDTGATTSAGAHSNGADEADIPGAGAGAALRP